MPTSDELVAWAIKHANELELDLSFHEAATPSGGWWKAPPSALPKVRARAIATLDFLEKFSGSDSQWAIRAHKVFDNHGERQTVESGARALSDILRAWAEAVKDGTIVPRQIEAQGVRVVASVDLMEQVRVLVADRTVHPAAPIMLAGAALEVALRSAVDEAQLIVSERPSITAYARLLRAANLLSAQDIKDVEQMSGVRNSAAHGEFENLSRERSGLMEQQVNLFLHRLSEILT
jgi:hypothetical protein